MPVNLVLWVWVTGELAVTEGLHLADVYIGSVRKTRGQDTSDGW